MRSIQFLTFDLETLPDGDYPKPEDVKVPANYKKQETIEAYQNDPANLDKLYEGRALDPIKGRILCISWILDDEPVRRAGDKDGNELNVLKQFEEQLKEQFKARFNGQDTTVRPRLIAHNGKKFDVPFLWLRIMKYNLEWLKKVIGEDPGDIRWVDTMLVMGVTNPYQNYISLNDACNMFGIKGKAEGFDGSMIYSAFKEGRYQEILDYCDGDTIACYELAKKLGVIS